MSDSVYKVIELIGTSSNSWEDAAKNAVERAGKSLKNLRIAEVKDLDMKVELGKPFYSVNKNLLLRKINLPFRSQVLGN